MTETNGLYYLSASGKLFTNFEEAAKQTLIETSGEMAYPVGPFQSILEVLSWLAGDGRVHTNPRDKP